MLHRSAVLRLRTMLALGAMVVSVAAGRAADGDADLRKQAEEIFAPPPKDMATPQFPIPLERVALGRRLYFGPRISVEGRVFAVKNFLRKS
jgi:cytochrome c peroxidase